MSFRVINSTVFCTKNINKYKNDDCTICRQSLNDDSIYSKEQNKCSTITTGNCGHSFHTECIEPWLKQYNKCPICAEVFN